MCRGIGKAGTGAGLAHDIVNESGRPRIVRVLPLGKYPAAGVVNAGVGTVRIAEWQALPPIIANPLPQSFFALAVERQLRIRIHHDLTETTPLAQRDLD